MSEQESNALGRMFGAWLGTVENYWKPEWMTLMKSVAASSPTPVQVDLAYQLLGKWEGTGMYVPEPWPEGPVLSFPADHGEHWDTSIEWRYFTLSLKLDDGSTFSVICNLFRKAIASAFSEIAQNPIDRQLYSTSWAWTWQQADGSAVHYAIPNLSFAPISGDPVVVQIEPFVFQVGTASIVSDGPGQDDIFPLKIHLEDAGDAAAGRPPMSLDVHCEATNPLFEQGWAGFVGTPPSSDGRPADGTRYYSWAQQRTTGTVTIDGVAKAVTEGVTWLDHQWGGSPAPTEAVEPAWAGWMWFEFQFRADRHPPQPFPHLSFTCSTVGMVENGKLQPPYTGFGSLVVGEEVLTVEVDIEVTAYAPDPSPWGVIYPTAWTMKITNGLSVDLTLEAQAVFDQQTLLDGHSAEYSEAASVCGIAGYVNLGDGKGPQRVDMTGVAYCESNGLQNPDDRNAMIVKVLSGELPHP